MQRHCAESPAQALGCLFLCLTNAQQEKPFCVLQKEEQLILKEKFSKKNTGLCQEIKLSTPNVLLKGLCKHCAKQETRSENSEWYFFLIVSVRVY